MRQTRLLLTGASGFLGWNIAQVADSEWEVHGVVNKNASGLASREYQLDLTDESATKALIDRIDPQVIIHTAATSNANFCEANPEAAYRINVDSTRFLARYAADKNIRFVFTSTDLVFDGTKGFYSENDPCNPVNTYGYQKVAAEEAIAKVNPDGVICRMPLLFGYSATANQSFLSGFLAKLRNNEELFFFTDEYRTPLGGQSAANGLLHAALHFPGGRYHMGGKKRLSRYDFGLLMSKTFGLDIKMIKPASQKDFKFAAERPPDVSLNSEKATKLGFAPMETEEELDSLKKRFA